MKKLLLAVIVILLAVVAVLAIVQGLNIGNFRVPSVSDLKASSQQITADIKKVEQKQGIEYNDKLGALKKEVTNLENSKRSYLEATASSTSEEITKAMQTATYKIEYLWTILGNYARKHSVNIKIVITTANGELGADVNSNSSINTLSFTVTGEYVAVAKFISSIEEDETLNFRIKDFTMGSAGSNLVQSTFDVRNVRIEGNSSKADSPVSSASTTTENSKDTNAKTNKSATK